MHWPLRPSWVPTLLGVTRRSRQRLLARILSTTIALGLTIAGCGPASTSPTHAATGPGTRDQRSTQASAERTTAETFAAAQVAVAYVTASCPFSWREPYGQRERRAAAYLTAAQAHARAPSPAGRAAWQASVVRDRLTGSCRVLDDQVLTEAPNSSDRRYLRVVVRRLISRDGQPPDSDEVDYCLVLVLVDGVWRVSGASHGG